MLQELRSEEFSRIGPLLSGERVNMEIRGVAAGYNHGWVLVDDRHAPQTALVFSQGQSGFYFLGREDNPSFLTKVHKTIACLQPRLASLSIKDFEYSGTSPGWDRTLAEIFADKAPQKFTQHVYTGDTQLSAPEIGEGAEEITWDLLHREGLNTAFAKRILLEWWESLDQFCAQGSGFCMLQAGQIVSLCYTSFIAPGEWELGVDTHPNFRRQGLAKLATAAMLGRCREQGVKPYWDCTETNTPSIKLASGLGLTLAFTYPAFWFSLD